MAGLAPSHNRGSVSLQGSVLAGGSFLRLACVGRGLDYTVFTTTTTMWGILLLRAEEV